MGRFTNYGFERDPLQTIIANERTKWKTRLGANGIDVDTENSILNILATITAESKFQADQIMEEAVANLTLAGAEGVYLDNILGKVTPRLGPQASTVNALVSWDYGTSSVQQISTTTLFNTKDGKKLYPTAITTLSESVQAVHVNSQLMYSYTASTPIYFYITFNGSSYSTSIPSVTGSSGFISNFYPSLSSWLINTVGFPSNLLFRTGSNAAIGFEQITGSDYGVIGYRPTGTGSLFSFTCSHPIISGFSSVEVKNEKVGYSPIAVNTVSSISPTFTGFIKAVNIDPGNYNGSDAESDTAYYLRYQRVTNDPKAMTREGVERALLESGIQKVSVTDGTAPYTGYIYVAGSPTDGRTTGKVIYDSKPIGFKTYGTSSESITTTYGGGIPEIVYWSNATIVNIDIQVNYQTSGVSLSELEKNSIRDIISDTIVSLNIGQNFYTSAIDSAILKKVDGNRFISIQSLVKRVDEVSYSTGYIALVSASTYYTIPDKILNIIFVQQ